MEERAVVSKIILTPEKWKRIVLEIFKQDREVESLKSLLEVEKKEKDLFKRRLLTSEQLRDSQHAYIVELRNQRTTVGAVARAAERSNILAWFEAQGFMPMMLLTGRAIANRLRKVLAVS